MKKAASIYGFKSRSSYYLFSKQIREQGFIGLFDLRPCGRKLKINQDEVFHKPVNIYTYKYSKRPTVALWNIINIPCNNAFHGLQRKNHKLFIQIVRAFAEGNGVRGISRIFDVDKNTVDGCRKNRSHLDSGRTTIF